MCIRRWFVLIVVVVTIPLSACKSKSNSGGGGGQTPAADKDRIIGSWLVVHAERSGQYHNDPVDGQLVLTFTADRVSSEWRKDSGSPFAGTYQLDATKQPKEIDLTMTARGKTDVSRGIYTLEGDELKICFGETRPTEMKTAKGDKLNLITFKRVSSDAGASAPAEVSLNGTWTAVWEGAGSPPKGAPPRLVITGNQAELLGAGSSDFKGTFTLDRSKSPAWIDLTITGGRLAETYSGKVSHGVFEIAGNRLKWSMNEPGKPERPADLTNSKGSRFRIMTFQREK